MSLKSSKQTPPTATDDFINPVEPFNCKTKDGVRFNVQTVKPAEQALKLAFDDEETAKEVLKPLVRQLYDKSYPATRDMPQIIIEAHSIHQPLVQPAFHFRLKSSLAGIALRAFAKHYPLILAPEHIWLAIATGAALHINKGDNAERLRDKFVSFKGKKTLEVRKDNITMGNVPRYTWENEIFLGFSQQIREHVGETVHDMFAKRFTTTTKTQQAAMDITLMAATREYFSFRLRTACGIPWIELKGTRQDWVDLRKRADDLRNFLVPEFASKWIPHLLPVLDEFVDAFDGNVNHQFWQRLCKVVRSNMSGQSDRISGWINNFYPYLQDGRENPYIKPWQHMSIHNDAEERLAERRVQTLSDDGPGADEFPMLMSSVPIIWDYHRVEFPLHLHAGYMGMTQDPESLALSPHIGWIITHDPKEQEHT